MDVIIQTNTDQYSAIGVNYFLTKYGFSPENVEEKLHLKILPDNHNIHSDTRISGWVEWKGISLPVFVPPVPVSDQGAPLLFYTDNSIKFPCAVITASNIFISLDIFRHLGLFLSGKLEKTWALLSEQKKDLIMAPFSDYYVDFLMYCIKTVHNEQTIPLVYKTLWPEGKPFAVHLSHDVDELKKTYQWLTHPWKYMKNHDIHGLYNQYISFKQCLRGKEPYWTFDSLMYRENELGVKSSFYFLNEKSDVWITDKKTWRHMGRRYDWDSPQVNALMKKMDNEGWEVGLHGSFNSYKDHNKIFSEKKALETVLGMSPIVGVRQHNLNLTIPDTWISHEKSGLLYDATLGYNDCMGFRWGTCLPFHPCLVEEKRTLKLLEIPLIIEDLPFFKDNHRCKDTVKIIQEVMNHQGVLSLLWHHSVFNDHEYPGWGNAYYRIINYCKKRDAWITTGKNIAQWWLQRETSNFIWNFDGRILSIIPEPHDIHHYFTVYCPNTLTFKSIKNAVIIQMFQDFFIIKTECNRSEERIDIEFERKENGL
jgi:hypothetical protein